MDLHVVELNVDIPAARVRATCEADFFRERGVYDAAGGSVAYSRPSLDASEQLEDPFDALALFDGRIADAVAAGIAADRNVVIVGGNCTSLPGTLGGMQQSKGSAARIGLVWFDAHGDFNTPKTTLTGRIGGMPVAVSAGLCHPEWRIGAHQWAALPTDRIVMVDVRNLDPAEERLMRATAVEIVPVSGPALSEAVSRLAAKVDVIYLHIDLDILDESLAPSHETKEPNGPDIQTTLHAVRSVLDFGKVEAVGLVAIYPTGEGAETSLSSAAELLRRTLSYWAASEPAQTPGDGPRSM